MFVLFFFFSSLCCLSFLLGPCDRCAHTKCLYPVLFFQKYRPTDNVLVEFGKNFTPHLEPQDMRNYLAAFFSLNSDFFLQHAERFFHKKGQKDETNWCDAITDPHTPLDNIGLFALACSVKRHVKIYGWDATKQIPCICWSTNMFAATNTSLHLLLRPSSIYIVVQPKPRTRQVLHSFFSLL